MSVDPESLSLQHPKVLSAVAKALVRKSEASPVSRKNRVGNLVRIPGFSKHVAEARKASDSRQPVYSDHFKLLLPGLPRSEWQSDEGLDW